MIKKLVLLIQLILLSTATVYAETPQFVQTVRTASLGIIFMMLALAAFINGIRQKGWGKRTIISLILFIVFAVAGALLL